MTKAIGVVVAAAFAATLFLVSPAGSEDTVYGLPRSETMVLGVVADVRTINPFLANMRMNTSIDYFHLHDVLAWRAPDGTITPRMAESWRRIDPLTWEFRLRDGIYSHGGEKLTSENVKFTLDLVRSRPEYAVYQLPEQTELDEV